MKYINDLNLKWAVTDLAEKEFTCGYCEEHNRSDKGMVLIETASDEYHQEGGIYICAHCKMPTFLWEDMQVPGVKIGSKISEVSSEITTLYDEARLAYSAGAYTGAVLLCQKILMNASVELGAEPNLSFVDYVDYLDENHYVTAKIQTWVNRLRLEDSEESHEIAIKTKQHAADLIKFCEMVMKINFEYPRLLEGLQIEEAEPETDFENESENDFESVF
ncbi:hypothetical protein M2139_000737 [Enterococcus sp. PF1-24]|uniref:hypothetical protein n=1 Tax=unclassified Enterococcus TaxID=2608891 RepID=UPI0024758C65|nr:MULTISPECIES: hypothetical protein [unclassified Enterococcus]MDH6363620.1 hypothetical protein [Enterococcus sp. PFB1-1]MDH6400855.1 hypothetical protein [Enterococcus sp. PF1-24]